MLRAEGVTVSDIYRARVILKAAAARLAAERQPARAAAALRAQIKVGRAVGDDVARLRGVVVDLPRILTEQSGNHTLAIIGSVLRRILWEHLAPATGDGGEHARLRGSVSSYEWLVSLIESGDGRRAQDEWSRYMTEPGVCWLADRWQASVIAPGD